MNRLIILLATFLFLILSSGIGNAAEIHVQPEDSIQTAVDNAISGDAILLKPGIYTENVKISKDNLTIISESGNPEDTVIMSRNSSDHVITLQADNVKVSGLGITGAIDSYAGIYLSECNNCILEQNKILNNGYGAYLLLSKGNTLSGNVISSNGVYGLFVCPRSDNNLVFNNYFNNSVNAEIKNGIGNAYNIVKAEGLNIVGGSHLGGNFWAEPDGTGFSETAVDADEDGIADSAYRLTNSIYSDELPLVPAGEPQQPALLASDFEIDSTSESSIRSINEGENDGSTEVSPEPASNVESKEISEAFITNDKEVKFDFEKNETCIAYLTFGSKKTVGKITATVEELKAKSSLVSVPVSGEVYKYFNIGIGNGGYATLDNMDNPVVCFRVEKAWIEDKNINEASITLSRFNAGRWEQLPANLSGEDDSFLYFTAQIPELSFFAITGESKIGEVSAKDLESEQQPYSQSGPGAKIFRGENPGAINNTNVEIALEKKATAPGFETVYLIVSMLVLFLYRKMKPEN
ncbi:PGF-pre-PGF domain-containing protein [Methanosarcina sp. MSH10X1]|uniref:PGF-pre-PGF domain-containing protein n=1 Tax=Methanosarcina sp. MSH10X1 TaxID=2507075 RepID=UPI0013E2B3D4|nr:PGF-pre-PGF domain-containing protein [Methanosarcina sp. MSH10X1]